MNEYYMQSVTIGSPIVLPTSLGIWNGQEVENKPFVSVMAPHPIIPSDNPPGCVYLSPEDALSVAETLIKTANMLLSRKEQS